MRGKQAMVLVALIASLGLMAGIASGGDAAAKDKPPWQRLLQGDDAKKAEQQEKQLRQVQSAGQWREALKLAEELVALRTKGQGADHWQTIKTRWEVKTLRRVLEQEDAARRNYARALVLIKQANALTGKGRFRDAQPLMEQVVAIHQKILGPEDPTTVSSNEFLAYSLLGQGQSARAEESLVQVVALRHNLLGDEHPDTARGYSNLALARLMQGKFAEAEQDYRHALFIQRKSLGEEDPVMAQSYQNLADCASGQGKYQEMLDLLRQALALRRKTLGEDHPATTTSYNILAGALRDQGQIDEAFELDRRALTIRRKVLGEEHAETANSFNNLAIDLEFQGKYPDALEYYNRALSIRKKVLGENHPQTAQSYNNRGNCLSFLGRYVEAEADLRQALALRLAGLGEKHPQTTQSYNNVAVNLHHQGKYAEAGEFYHKALAIRRAVLGEMDKLTANSYSGLAQNLYAQGKYEEAEQAQRKALTIWSKLLGEEHPLTAGGFHKLATTLHAQGHYPEAETLLVRAADAFAQVRLRLASSGLERAAKTGEDSPLAALAAVLARNNKPNEAWQRFEQSLARGTWDDLSARLRRPAAEQAKQANLTAGLDRLDQFLGQTFAGNEDAAKKARRKELLTQRRQLQEQLHEFGQKLAKTYGPVASQISEREQIQAALPANTALVGWLDIAGQAYAADPSGEHWAILLRASGPTVCVRLTGSGSKGAWTAEDDRRAADLRSALQTPGGAWQPLGRRLRQQRLQPLVPHLKGIQHLLVLPSIALAGVPVEAVAEGYTVSYALSGTLHAHLHRQTKVTTRGLLALADPVFESTTTVAARTRSMPTRGEEETWPTLPGTRAEVEALSRLFRQTNGPTRLLCDSQASEQQLGEMARKNELARYRFLHLATHGTMDESYPLRSAVILAQDNLPDSRKQLEAHQPIYDGRLTAREVLEQWHLNSDLVTLSACQTALGKYERGEGYVGFAQALMLAGSRSVCLSLWKVDDTATALLMERFYQNLLGKREGLDEPLGKAAALAEAKKWLRELSQDDAKKLSVQLTVDVTRGKGRKIQPLLPAVPEATSRAKNDRPFSHPYYWAAFVLLGDAE